MANRYDLNDLIRCSAVFTDADDAVSDPSTVVFTYREPDGTKGTYTYDTDAELVRDGAGTYHVDLTPDSVGNWWFQWQSTGTPTQVAEDHFAVKFSEI